MLSIGHGGYVELVAPEVGPERQVRVLSFQGRGDTGFIPQGQMRAGENPVAIVNVTTGALATGHFGGFVTGGLSQTDTGDFTGQTFFAIVTDTGAAG